MPSQDRTTFDLDRSIEVLERTPCVLRAMLGGISDFWSRRNYGESTFSPFDVVGHLVHGEHTNWMPRVRIILRQADGRFPPFDRYAMFASSQGKNIDDLLKEFAEVRAKNLSELRSLQLTLDQFELAGSHPEFGKVVLRQLLAAWVVHDLGHTHQIAKAMAFQYRMEVGPWAEFLSILPTS